MLDRRTLYRVAMVLACLLWPGDRLVAQASAGATPTGTTQTTSPANKKPATKKTPANSATGKATTASTKEKAPATTTQKTSHAGDGRRKDIAHRRQGQ